MLSEIFDTETKTAWSHLHVESEEVWVFRSRD